LQENLAALIADGKVQVHENDRAFIKSIEQHYPFGHSTIQWHTLTGVQHIDLNEIDKNKHQQARQKFLDTIAHNLPELLNERVIVLGDGAINLAYGMKFGVFIAISEHFFSLPQHTYVWFPASKKCINLTFRDDLYFG
jgi:hypothetical protein